MNARQRRKRRRRGQRFQRLMLGGLTIAEFLAANPVGDPAGAGYAPDLALSDQLGTLYPIDPNGQDVWRKMGGQ